MLEFNITALHGKIFVGRRTVVDIRFFVQNLSNTPCACNGAGRHHKHHGKHHERHQNLVNIADEL